MGVDYDERSYLEEMDVPEDVIEKVLADDSEGDRRAMILLSVGMHYNGLRIGKRIAELVRELEPDADHIIPLYRSAVCLIHLDDQLHMIAYHDPAWVGRDLTTDTLREHRREYSIIGQRDGIEIFKSIDRFEEDTLMMLKDAWNTLNEYDAMTGTGDEDE